MFMVVVLYVLGQGGILQALSDALLGINYEVAWFMEAMALLLLFAKMEIKSKLILTIIRYASPLAFGVYIIHTNCWVWNYWLSGRFSSFAEKTPAGLVLSVLGAALCIYEAVL